MPALSASHRWSEIVARQERSGLTIRDFARRNGLNANTLTWWRWRLRQEPLPSPELVDFIEAQVIEHRPEQSGIEVRLDHLGVRITIQEDTDFQKLRRLLEALC